MDIVKNSDEDKYKYFGYGICFDALGDFSIDNVTNGRNVMILGANMSFSSKTYTQNNNIYVLSHNFIQGFSKDGGGHSVYAKGKYKTNFTAPNKRFVLSLHYNNDDFYLTVNGQEQLKLKAKIDYTNTIPLCLGNITNNWSITYAKHTGFYGNIYDFVVDYIPINGVKTIYNIHRYLMTKHNIIINVQFDKKGLILILVTIANAMELHSKNCLLLNDQKCGVNVVK